MVTTKMYQYGWDTIFKETDSFGKKATNLLLSLSKKENN